MKARAGEGSGGGRGKNDGIPVFRGVSLDEGGEKKKGTVLCRNSGEEEGRFFPSPREKGKGARSAGKKETLSFTTSHEIGELALNRESKFWKRGEGGKDTK